jgi:O-antigen/teichoic acid export membrane protein
VIGLGEVDNRMILPSRLAGYKWPVLDQLLVSLFNLILGVYLARALGPRDFGAFAVMQLIVGYVLVAQTAMVVGPMTTARRADGPEDSSDYRLGGFLGCSVLLQVGWMILIGIGAGILHLTDQAPETAKFVPVLLAWVAVAQIQDWGRRAHYVVGQERFATVSDVLGYGGAVLTTMTLHYIGSLTVIAASWAFTGCLVASASYSLYRLRVRPSRRETAQVIRSNWQHARNLLVANQLQWAGSSGLILVAGALSGVRVVGAFRAMQNVVGFVNVLFQTMDNILPRRFANLVESGRIAAVRSEIRRLDLLGGVAFAFLILASVFSLNWITATVLGAEYREHGYLLIGLLFYHMFGYWYRIRTYYLRALQDTSPIAKSTLAWALCAIASFFLAHLFVGEPALILSLLVGGATGLIFLAWICRRKSHPN